MCPIIVTMPTGYGVQDILLSRTVTKLTFVQFAELHKSSFYYLPNSVTNYQAKQIKLVYKS